MQGIISDESGYKSAASNLTATPLPCPQSRTEGAQTICDDIDILFDDDTNGGPKQVTETSMSCDDIDILFDEAEQACNGSPKQVTTTSVQPIPPQSTLPLGGLVTSRIYI